MFGPHGSLHQEKEHLVPTVPENSPQQNLNLVSTLTIVYFKPCSLQVSLIPRPFSPHGKNCHYSLCGENGLGTRLPSGSYAWLTHNRVPASRTAMH